MLYIMYLLEIWIFPFILSVLPYSYGQRGLYLIFLIGLDYHKKECCGALCLFLYPFLLLSYNVVTECPKTSA